MKTSIAKWELDLLRKANVVGMGTGRKIVGGVTKPEIRCVSVFVTEKVPKEELRKRDLVPLVVNGMPTDVVETGEFKAFSYTGRYRPAPGGVSVGHKDITAGTLGMWVQMPDASIKLLSNNHVLANSNEAAIGDPILQPGAYDGGTVENDTIAHLHSFVPIVWETSPPTPPECPIGGAIRDTFNWGARVLGRKSRLLLYEIQQDEYNQVDAALATPINEEVIRNEVLEIGMPKAILPENDITYGMMVQKTGRTTGYTTAMVTDEMATVRVSYGDGKTALFTGQVVTQYMSDGGDSGSVVFEGSGGPSSGGQIVGLLFAGSSSRTIFSPMAWVQALLGNFDVIDWGE